MSQPLLSLIGPTATGKSELALQLTKVLEFEGFDIVSADSRQVYKGMEIGTGADVPPAFERQNSFFVKNNVRIHGLALILPTEEWSLGHFRTMAKSILEKSWQANSLPIVVGGTGLYHRQLTSEDTLQEIPPNEEVREAAATKTLHELQDWLKKVSPHRYSEMNHSDSHNPRRLVRAIEQVLFLSTHSQIEPPQEKKAAQDIHHVTIGLIASVEYLKEKIRQRIETRLQYGMIEEVQKLMADYADTDWKLPAFSATGYKEVRAYLEEKISLEELKELWLTRELQYAKRQLTWWKKQPNIHWLNKEEHFSLDNVKTLLYTELYGRQATNSKH